MQGVVGTGFGFQGVGGTVIFVPCARRDAYDPLCHHGPKMIGSGGSL
jgi:hypothetical protein